MSPPPAGAQHGGRVHDRGGHAPDHRRGARHRGGRHGARHPRRVPRVPGAACHDMSRVTCLTSRVSGAAQTKQEHQSEDGVSQVFAVHSQKYLLFLSAKDLRRYLLCTSLLLILALSVLRTYHAIMQASCLVMAGARYVGGETPLGRENHKHWLETGEAPWQHRSVLTVCTMRVVLTCIHYTLN